MKFSVFPFLLFTLITQSLLAQNIHWASDIIGYSSQRSSSLFSAEQAKGNPNKYPVAEFTPCAWMPASDQISDTTFLHVAFNKAINTSEIILCQSFQPIFPYRIDLISQGQTFKTISSSPGGSAHVMRFHIPENNKPVESVRFVWIGNTSSLQVDAIGISTNEGTPISFLTDTFYRDIESERIQQFSSPTDEVMPVISPDGSTIYFDRKKHPENIGEDLMDDIWYAVKESDSTWSAPQQLGPPVNNDQHNYVNAIDRTGNTLIVGNAYNQDGVLCKISRTDSGWTSPAPIYIEQFENNDQFNEFYISPDETWLLFSIELEAGLGMRDIYISKIISENRYGKPINLGNQINTAAIEMSPFLAMDQSTLYFASNGHPGYGNMDLYMSRRLDDTWTNWSEPVNLGPSINTDGWEAYFTTDVLGDFAYYCSSAGGDDLDIYKAPLSPDIQPDSMVYVRFNVIDRENTQTINATVKYLLLDNISKDSIQGIGLVTEKKTALYPDSRYMIIVEADGYFNVVLDISTAVVGDGITSLDIPLIPKKEGASFVLENVYFKANSSTLIDQSFSALNELANFMITYQEVEIEIVGHTNGLCDETFCQSLSSKRAESIVSYLIDAGIGTSRISFKGMGKSKPIADNATPEGRQLNQRVEFVLLKVD